jgi:hypothetical protein
LDLPDISLLPELNRYRLASFDRASINITSLPFYLFDMMSLSLKSRAQGGVWGVCVADALGGPVQFKDPGTFKPITGLRFVGPYEQPAG